MGGINNNGQVAVYGRPLPGGQVQAYRYSEATGFEPLGDFGGTRTEAEGINNSGQVTGFSEDAAGRIHAFRYTDGVGLENLGTAFRNSRGYAINDLGWVAGAADGNAVVFREQGSLTLLPGSALGINNAGNVVGTTTVVPGHTTAFVHLDGQMFILGDNVFGLPTLYDINNHNVAVGSGYLDGNLVALLWRQDLIGIEPAGLVDLNTLIAADSGWTLLGARAINDAGQIVGFGTFNGEFLAYRLDPVPEPSTWGLFALGAGFLWVCRRGRKP
jgi:probable HAF family extracellular repeat protein